MYSFNLKSVFTNNFYFEFMSTEWVLPLQSSSNLVMFHVVPQGSGTIIDLLR